jgi:hypothetical protein
LRSDQQEVARPRRSSALTVGLERVMSGATVIGESHLKAIFRKQGASERARAVALAPGSAAVVDPARQPFQDARARGSWPSR